MTFDLTDLFEKLQNGEVIKCGNCETGFYRPLEGVEAKICTQFVCDNCGDRIIGCKKLVL